MKPPRLNNVFGNAAGGTYPQASASYTFTSDVVTELNDGIVLYDRSVNGSPNNANVHNRWTNYSSPNATDWVQVDMGAPTSINEVTLDVYDDTIGVILPTTYATRPRSTEPPGCPSATSKCSPQRRPPDRTSQPSPPSAPATCA